MATAVEVINLVKRYENNTVIPGLTISVRQGEIFALLGANGAGKTTTLECIEGIRSYHEGDIRVHGRIGVQLQSSSLLENITAIEAYKLFCLWNKSKIDKETLHSFGIMEFRNKQYRTLSTGQKRRLHLAIALINDPDIVILDEPTAGLDVEGRVSLHKEIRKIRDSGKTILMASHDMAEVESLCDRIAILKEGKLAFLGTADELTGSHFGESKISFRVRNQFPEIKLSYSKLDQSERNYFTVTTTEIADALYELLTLLKEMDNEVLDIKIEHASLEERFIEIAKEGR
ncbi:MAG: ABC transporter ATP-binding protein [Clostridiales bacterium]|nr:ABC transporter ATP-binding protein [Clostridiales bacterium]